jgi:hypothetical protein
MTDAEFLPLTDRGIVSLAGDDATGFLQGLVTNDVTTASDDRVIYAALLTPQGKYLHDFFVLRSDHALYLECDARRLEDLVRRLSRYRLRAKVDISDASDRFGVYALFGSEALQRVGLAADEGRATRLADGIAFVDPRNAALGARALLPGDDGAQRLKEAGFSPSNGSTYDTLRMSLAIAAGDPEIEPEKSLPMEYGLDELHGVSFTKGCSVGPEVTVRMKTRGLVRKRLVPVRIEGGTPVVGTALHWGNKTVGELRAICGAAGLALVRIDALDEALTDGTPFEAGASRLYPQVPESGSR